MELLLFKLILASPGKPSPLGTPGITYKWRKDDQVIAGQTGPQYTINATGKYYVEIDYGSCSTISSITKSQEVTVTVLNSSTNVSLVSSLDLSQQICPSTPTTLSTIPGYSYKWFKNGEVLNGVTTFNYTTGEAGKYSVEVNFGNCTEPKRTNELEVKSFDFNLGFTDASIKLSPAINYIEENETLTLIANTNATSPSYEWYEPGSLVPASTNDNFTVSNPIDGEYRLVVYQNTGCEFDKTLKFKVKIGVPSVKIPNVISPNDQNGENDTWILPEEYKASNIEVLIMDRYGKEVLRKMNYDDTWPVEKIEFQSINPIYYYVISKDGNPVKKGSITVIK